MPSDCRNDMSNKNIVKMEMPCPLSPPKPSLIADTECISSPTSKCGRRRRTFKELNRSFVCNVCNRPYASLHALRQHKRLKHLEEPSTGCRETIKIPGNPSMCLNDYTIGYNATNSENLQPTFATKRRRHTIGAMGVPNLNEFQFSDPHTIAHSEYHQNNVSTGTGKQCLEIGGLCCCQPIQPTPPCLDLMFNPSLINTEDELYTMNITNYNPSNDGLASPLRTSTEFSKYEPDVTYCTSDVDPSEHFKRSLSEGHSIPTPLQTISRRVSVDEVTVSSTSTRALYAQRTPGSEMYTPIFMTNDQLDSTPQPDLSCNRDMNTDVMEEDWRIADLAGMLANNIESMVDMMECLDSQLLVDELLGVNPDIVQSNQPSVLQV